MDFIKNAVEGVKDAVEGLGDGAMRGMMGQVLTKVVEDTLAKIGPDVGEAVAQKMVKKYKALGKIDTVPDTAKKAADEAVQGQKETIMDFTKEVAEDFDAALPKVGSLLAKAIKKGSNDAVDSVLKLVPCSCLCGMCRSANDIKKEAFEEISEQMRAFIKGKVADPASMGIPVPGPVTAKINEKLAPLLEFNADMDVGQPKSKSAPQPETMGAQS